MFAKTFRCFLLAACLPLAAAQAQQEPTLENLLCALQERHLVILQQKEIIRFSQEDLFLQQYMETASEFQNIELEVLEWKFLQEKPFPTATDIQGLTFKEKYILLQQAAAEFDQLKYRYLNFNLESMNQEAVGDALPISSGYTRVWRSGQDPYVLFGVDGYTQTFLDQFPLTVDGHLPYPSTKQARGYIKPKTFDLLADGFTDRDLPSVTPFTHWDFHQTLVALSDRVRRLRAVKWPALAYSPWIGMGLHENPATQEVDKWWFAYDQDVELEPLPFSMIEVPVDPEDPESEMRVAWYLDFFDDTPPTVAQAELFYKLMMQEHHNHTGDWNPQDKLHGYAGGMISWDPVDDHPGEALLNYSGAFAFFRDGSDMIHGIGGTVHRFDTIQQLAVTVEGTREVRFLTHVEPTPSGKAVYRGETSFATIHADPLVHGQAGAPSFSKVTKAHLPPDFPAQHSYFTSNNPVVDGADSWYLYEKPAFEAFGEIFGVFVPSFLYLADPLPVHTEGPGSMGDDYPDPQILPRVHYTIELGDGVHTRGNQGGLQARYDGDEFLLEFHGDAHEYNYDEDVAENIVSYTGGLTRTEIKTVTFTNIVVTQTLTQALPDGMGAADTVLKKFEFITDAEATPPSTRLTCSYGTAPETVVRKWTMDATTLYAGDDPTNAPRKWVRTVDITQLGPEESPYYNRFRHEITSVGTLDVYEKTMSGTAHVRSLEFDMKLSPRRNAALEQWHGPGLSDELESFVNQTTFHSLDGAPERVLETPRYETELYSSIVWNGPGSFSETYDPDGALTQHVGSAFLETASFSSGNIHASTRKHSGNDLRTRAVEWTGLDEWEVTDLIPTDGTSTTIHLWDPTDAGTPAGQVPWGLRRINHPDGTVTLISDLLTATGRTRTVFQGTADASGNEIEGIRTVTVYNRLGAVKSRESTWRPDGLVLSSQTFTQSRLGPTLGEDTDGFDTTFGWNAAGELTGTLGRSGGFSVEDRDAIGRITDLVDTLTGVETELIPDGNRIDMTRTSGATSHTGHSAWNAFGETTSTGYDGAQKQTSNSDWNGGLWSGGGDNKHTHAGIDRSFNEATLESIIRSKTGPGLRTTVAYEALGGIPCLRIETFAVQPGLIGGVEKPVSQTLVDGLGRVRRESAPDPSQPGLVWQHTDYYYDHAGRVKRIDLPSDPDLLFAYDSLSRPWRRALDLNGNGEINPGIDAVFETTYDVVNGKWVEETKVHLSTGVKTLSKVESDAVARSFSRQLGTRTTDTLVSTTPAPGQEQVTLNGRTVFQSTPTTATVTDNSNGEALPLSRTETTVSALGVPETVSEQAGPMTRALTFNTSAEPASLVDAGIVSSFGHQFNPDASSTHETDYGALEGPTVALDPGASTTDVGGGGGMPHETGLDWTPTHGWKQTLSLAGGNQSEWHINPAGRVTKKIHTTGDEFTFSYNAAGQLTGQITPAGSQSWETDPDSGFLKKWKVDGVEQFEITEHDVLGRPKMVTYGITHDSGPSTQEIEYDNNKWTQDTVEWLSGPLQGFKLDDDADARGRLDKLTVSKDLADLYEVTHKYRGESDHIDTLTVTAPDAPTVTIDINGPGGVADIFIYKVGGQETFRITRSRNGDGRLNGITAPGFSQSWTLDAMGRVDVLTTNGKPTDYGYHPANGTLASAVSPDEARIYTFTDRGELQEEVINGETLAMLADVNQSGALAQRENLRELTLKGTFHTNAVVNVLVGTNVVYNTSLTPFEFTFDAGTVPALANTNAVVSLDWSVVGTLPGAQYEGGNAVSKIAGEHLFAPQAEAVTYDIATRRNSDAILTYGWNAANQVLMLEELHGPHRTEHDYDGSQRRVEKRVYHNGNLRRTHRFVYDGWLPVVEEVTDQWGNLDYRNLYIYGPGPDGARRPGLGATGQLALIIHLPKFGPPQLSAPVLNHRLDIVALIDVETGNVVARYGYTPFGETTYAVGSRAEQNPFRFAGAYYDAEVKLYAFGYRYYDPRTKSWLSRDPIGEAGGLNLFSYASNDPINGVDVLGLDVMTMLDSFDAGSIHYSELGPLAPASQSYQSPQVIYLGDSGYISMVKGIKSIPTVYSMNRQYYGNHWYAFETTFNPMSKIIHSGYELNTGVGIRPYNVGMELTGDDRLGNWMEIGLSTVEVGGLGWGAVAMKRGVASSLTRSLTPDTDLPPGTGVYAWDEISDIPRSRADFIVSPDGTAVATPRTSFYVGPDGTTVPSTGYRYMHSKYAPMTMESMSAPLSYFGFEKFNSSSLAASRFQILRPDWSDVRLRGKFDTLQLFDENGVFNARVPFADNGRASFLEPFANFYPEATHGIGGARQLVPIFDIDVKFNELILLRDK